MKQQVIFLLAFLSCMVLVPFAEGEYPVGQWDAWRPYATGRYPEKIWLKYAIPEEAGWSSEKLQKAHDYFETLNSAAAMVIYDGAVLAAWGNVETRYMCHSIRKSLLSALYGAHVTEGNVNINHTLADLNIDDDPPLTDSEKQARVVDLLRSRSGIYHPAAYETQKMKEKRPEQGSHAPGEIFWYNNWDFNALCTIFEQETGTGVFSEFQKRFAIPLQMEDFRLQDGYYHLEPNHSCHPAYPFRLSARDMARFGLLFLRDGKWQDQQILSKEWVRESTASHFEKGDTTNNPQYGYGYLWWRVINGPFKDLQMYSARGFGGHAIDIVPSANLVLVHRVDTFWDLTPSFRTERKRVEDSERFKLLDLILQARTAKPSSNPGLVPWASPSQQTRIVSLDQSILARYVAEYQFKEFRLRVQLVDGELALSGSKMGVFRIFPLSETVFVMEDIGAQVIFDLDQDKQPIAINVKIAPDQTFQGSPISS